ncbi:hypothetical protein COCC4DRAFT_22375 [Bipolaris maydis ATCC 48331]|uniref:Uncharacterized protein n=2 Tax=Cochliobolus heterostrophus TaxID=5016 RepID=M2SQT4_COCH5|nr:uncharacterized protein COCC4DRAFT_22375 [Bipolaris maydis ATCC 48331]EMD87685.1 hypothetical protein COCHEDRAFT_1034064 [Bipolaris maydis C5]ENI06884.1 hypothetical protein COCC4DRAFT_22375 [Bipolaris maydis ATCC 48331]KAJ6211922.1 hypothetical protein PSV09DRAFT_1034064 [Bipolaris maydis]
MPPAHPPDDVTNTTLTPPLLHSALPFPFVSKKPRTHTPCLHTHRLLSITTTTAAAAAIYVPYCSRPVWHSQPPAERHHYLLLACFPTLPNTQLGFPAPLQSLFSYRVYANRVAHIVSTIYGLASQVLPLLFVPQDATASGAQAASVASPKRHALGVEKGAKASSFPKTHQTKHSPMQCLLAVPAATHAGESGHARVLQINPAR